MPLPSRALPDLAAGLCFLFILLVPLAAAGLAMINTGLGRSRNAAHMMMMNIAAFAVAFLAYYTVGFAFQFGGIAPIFNLGGVAPLTGSIGHGSTGILGTHGFLLQSHGTYDVGVIALFLFQVVFMETAGYIIIGAIAERISFAGFILAELAMGAVIYPIYGNWVWGGGFLAHLGSSMHWGHGAVDFAGSGVVHATGGWAALALAVILGPRIGKFNKDGTPNAFPGHNIGYVVLGTMILLFGWMGFNPGSTLAASDLRISVIAVNTNLAAVAGAASAMFLWYYLFGKPDVTMACNGMLAGLVAITAPCAFVSPNSAVVIGLLAGVLVDLGVLFNERVIKVDDPCGAISVHGYCGWLGAVCVGIFADGTYGAGWNGVGATTYLGKAGMGVTGLLYGDSKQFITQLGGTTLCAVYAFGFTYVVFSLVNAVRSMRVSKEVEMEGLDVPEFGLPAYPEDELVDAGSPVAA